MGTDAKKKRTTPKSEDSSVSFEEVLRKRGTEKYVLRLYVAGTTPRSLRAITNLKRICEANLQGRCELEVIDVYQQPSLAKGAQIIAVPTLIKKLPSPLRKFVGDLADQEKILLGLDLRTKSDPENIQKPISTRKERGNES